MHAIWKGCISFGLVNIPVKMHSATREQELKFVLLHKKDQSQIRYAHVCKAEEKEVPWEEIVKGYEYHPGEFVVLDKEDFEKVNLEKTKSIEIVTFIPEKEVDSIYFVKPYFLVPEKGAAKAYHLLCEALRKTKKVGLARYVYHNREHVAIIKEYDKAIILNQLRYQDEILKLPKEEIPKIVKTTSSELEAATQLINQLTSRFKPEEYKSTYIEEIKEIIQQKAKGKKAHPKGHEPKPTKVHDIMSLLKASLQQTKKSAKKSVKKTA